MQTYHRAVYEAAPATVAIPSVWKRRRVEVIFLLLDEAPSDGTQKAVDALGWPVGFFAATYGALPDFPARELKRNRPVCTKGNNRMLASLIDEAMERAVYEIIEDEGSYWGEIPEFQGVWARAKTLEGCRRDLREALSDWIALRLHLGLPIPIVAELDLSLFLQPV